MPLVSYNLLRKHFIPQFQQLEPDEKVLLHHWGVRVEVVCRTHQLVMSIFLKNNESVMFVVLIAYHFPHRNS
jgi:hypothetical protein